MTDRTTKVLLALIALGLWVNVTLEVFRPVPASAQFSDIETKITRIESDLDDIEDGTCLNKKLCR